MSEVKRFVLAPDSFKESLSAKAVCEAMELGIKKIFPDAIFIHVPMADGGEGTVDALVDATNGERKYLTVTDPLGKPVEAYYGLLGDGRTAVIEMAMASGLELVAEQERNPLLTSTFGTGEMIRACLDEGVEKIVIGIGGSATNDGGMGMAKALGARFLDENDQEIPEGGGHLNRLAKIDNRHFDQRIKKVEIEVACDVNNPLCGPNGAAHVFGPQKGATPEMVGTLDKNLAHYAEVLENTFNEKITDIPGAGAAGGLGAGLLVFTQATLKKGVEIVIEETHLAEQMVQADFCFTGEGGMDFQTKFGKAPYGVAQIAQKNDVPVIALTGNVGKDIDVLYDEGITAIFNILTQAVSINEALQTGHDNIVFTCENIARTLKMME